MYKHTFYYFSGNKKYPEIYILRLKTLLDTLTYSALIQFQAVILRIVAVSVFFDTS